MLTKQAYASSRGSIVKSIGWTVLATFCVLLPALFTADQYGTNYVLVLKRSVRYSILFLLDGVMALMRLRRVRFSILILLDYVMALMRLLLFNYVMLLLLLKRCVRWHLISILPSLFKIGTTR